LGPVSEWVAVCVEQTTAGQTEGTATEHPSRRRQRELAVHPPHVDAPRAAVPLQFNRPDAPPSSFLLGCIVAAASSMGCHSLFPPVALFFSVVAHPSDDCAKPVSLCLFIVAALLSCTRCSRGCSQYATYDGDKEPRAGMESAGGERRGRQSSQQRKRANRRMQSRRCDRHCCCWYCAAPTIGRALTLEWMPGDSDGNDRRTVPLALSSGSRLSIQRPASLDLQHLALLVSSRTAAPAPRCSVGVVRMVSALWHVTGNSDVALPLLSNVCDAAQSRC